MLCLGVTLLDITSICVTSVYDLGEYYPPCVTSGCDLGGHYLHFVISCRVEGTVGDIISLVLL